MALISLRSLAHVNVSVISTKADYLSYTILKITSKYYVNPYINGPGMDLIYDVGHTSYRRCA